jgi:fatty acid-binding protein DegV
VALLQAMSQAVFQGVATHRTRKPTVFDSHQAKMLYQFLVNTCYVWREDGPFVELFKKKLHLK